MSLEENVLEKHKKIFKEISGHLENTLINPEKLDEEIVSDLIVMLSEIEYLDEFELKKICFEKGLVTEKECCDHLSAAYFVGLRDEEMCPSKFFHFVPQKTIKYFLVCELKAALKKDSSYTIHGTTYKTLNKISVFFRKVNSLDIYNYNNLLQQAKKELGLVEPRINKKKERRKKQPKQPKPKKDAEISKSKNPPWLESEYVPLFQTQPQKVIPAEPGKKRRQKLKPIFDPVLVEKRIKNKITAGEPLADIIDYVTEQTGSSPENSRMFFEDMVYEAIKSAVWTDKSVSKNTITYISKNKQIKIADDYISRNAISETIGIQRVTASKDLLLKHLGLEETTIDEIISAKLQKYAEISERIDAEHSSQALLEERIAFNERPVFVTKHVKERALQRIGAGTNKSEFLREMFYSGRTVYVHYDSNPHRIFEFGGEEFEVPYVDTGDDYVLLTVFPRKNY